MTPFLAASFNPLSFDPGALWLTTLTFLTLILLLSKFTWKPMLQAISAREDRIAGAIKKAEEDRKHADELLASYKERVANVEQEIADLREKGKADAEALAREVREKADAEAKSRLDRALAEIDGARTQALEDIRKEAVGLGLAAATKVVGRSLDDADHQRLAAEVVAGLTAVGSGTGA